ncbi:MAG: hypothetical protein HC802_02975, partial [Caldilineaceae bacterium]|nr:hypothetical protein [Caldilineaceae bacterium]
MLENHGWGKLSDLCDDLVVYRNLRPLDDRLPDRRVVLRKAGLSNDRTPRKVDGEYAQVALWIAREAQKVRGASVNLQELLFIGDTLYNDGQAYRNMKKVSGWQSACFICSEALGEEPSSEVDDTDEIFCANRWSALGAWIGRAREQGMALDSQTLVVIDIDKTALGAKGRNDKVIDKARLEGIYRTMDAVLGDDFDRAAFETHYAELNHARYHPLTADNQDYLAYVCLVINAGLIDFDEVVSEMENGSLDNFEQFLRWVDTRMMGNPLGGESFRQVHESVVCSVRIGDPTPFKSFRRQEFISTVEHMGVTQDGAAVEEVIAQEITLTQEIFELARWLRSEHCL